MYRKSSMMSDLLQRASHMFCFTTEARSSAQLNAEKASASRLNSSLKFAEEFNPRNSLRDMKQWEVNDAAVMFDQSGIGEEGVSFPGGGNEEDNTEEEEEGCGVELE